MTTTSSAKASHLSYREQLPDSLQFYKGTMFAYQSEPTYLYQLRSFDNGKYVLDATDINTGEFVKTIRMHPKTLKTNVANSSRVAEYMLKRLEDTLKLKYDIEEIVSTKEQAIAITHDIQSQKPAVIGYGGKVNPDFIKTVDDYRDTVNAENDAYTEKYELIVATSEHTPTIGNGQDFYHWCNEQEQNFPLTFPMKSVDELRIDFMVLYHLEQTSKSVKNVESDTVKSSDVVNTTSLIGSINEKDIQNMSDVTPISYDEFLEKQTEQDIRPETIISDNSDTSEFQEPKKTTQRIGGTVSVETSDMFEGFIEFTGLNKNEALELALNLLEVVDKSVLKQALSNVYDKRLNSIFKD